MQADKFILRTPLLKVSGLATTEEALLEAYTNPEVRQALFVASADLFAELNKLEAGEITDREKRSRILISLYKYHTRMCTRCTPFGYFSGISMGSVADETTLRLSGGRLPRTRLDMDFLCNLYYDLSRDTSLFRDLTFYPNNTLYKIHDQWRYVEYQFRETGIFHNLVSIDDNEVLTKILDTLGEAGGTVSQAVQIITDFGFDEAEADAYLSELILSQVLVSQLYPSVSGVEYQYRLFGELERLFPEKYRNLNRLTASVLDGEKDAVEKMAELKRLLAGFGFTTQSNHLVQVDLYKQTEQCSISRAVVARVGEATHLLARLMVLNQAHNHLERFKKAFYERYEDAFMPLSQVMDTDIGIGYKNAVSISDHRNGSEKNAHEKRVRAFKLNLFKKGLLSGSGSVDIAQEDARPFLAEPVAFPDTYSFMGSLLCDGDGQALIRYKSAGGASAIDIIGRFGHLHPEVEELCLTLADAETRQHPEAVIAEILHLPQGKIGNVVTRPHYHRHEIPYLCHPTLPREQQIPVDDLYIGLVNFRLVLYSKRLGREVIPRLNNAHNYLFDSLPLYHFLCDLQNQQKEINFFWSWDDLQNEAFLPRVCYKNIVLSPARWNVDTLPFRKIDPAKDAEAFYAKVREINLPEQFVLIQGDNELYIDISAPLGIATFLRYCHKRDTLHLEEFIATDDAVSGGYANEIIIPYRGRETPAEPGIRNLPPAAMEQQLFTPLSEWVFFKCYTGKKYIGKLLAEVVPDLIDELKGKNLILKWFFIRYADPKDHLRIRFLLRRNEDRGSLMDIVDTHLREYVLKQIIWDLQIGTYRRELNRYGADTIGESEDWFYHNSTLVLETLRMVRENEGKNLLFFALFFTDALLNQFHFSDVQKSAFLNAQSALYNAEFGIDTDKDLRIGLNNEFRKIHAPLRDMLKTGSLHFDTPDHQLRNICLRNIENTRNIADTLKRRYAENRDKLESIIASYIHMFINRLFVSNQRYNEMTVYYFLSKYQASEIARKSTATAVPQLKET